MESRPSFAEIAGVDAAHAPALDALRAALLPGFTAGANASPPKPLPPPKAASHLRGGGEGEGWRKFEFGFEL